MMGYLPYQLVQDLFHQRYDWIPRDRESGLQILCVAISNFEAGTPFRKQKNNNGKHQENSLWPVNLPPNVPHLVEIKPYRIRVLFAISIPCMIDLPA